MTSVVLKVGNLKNYYKFASMTPSKILGKFDNLVNYQTIESNITNFIIPIQLSSDPTSLAFLSQNNQIIEYHLINEGSDLPIQVDRQLE